MDGWMDELLDNGITEWTDGRVNCLMGELKVFE